MVVLLAGIVLASANASTPTKAALVYQRGGDLYATSVDGSRTVRVTRTRPVEAEPAVSPDGTMIAYAGESGISVATLSGLRRTVVTRGPDSMPAWSPDGRTLYFVRFRDNRFGASCGSIFAVSTSSQQTRRVTNAFATGHSHVHPAISPDGRRIAFSDWNACEGGTSSPRLRVVDTSGRPVSDLAKLRRNGYYPDPEHSSPAWSPDGGRLAFFKNSELTIANRDGSGERRLTPRTGHLIYEPPAWSPDGRWIAFVRYTGSSSSSGLFVVRPGGTGLRRLAPWTSREQSIGGWLPRLPK